MLWERNVGYKYSNTVQSRALLSIVDFTTAPEKAMVWYYRSGCGIVRKQELIFVRNPGNRDGRDSIDVKYLEKGTRIKPNNYLIRLARLVKKCNLSLIYLCCPGI